MNLSGIGFSNLDKSYEETQTLELSLSQNKFVDLQKLSTEIALRKDKEACLILLLLMFFRFFFFFFFFQRNGEE